MVEDSPEPVIKSEGEEKEEEKASPQIPDKIDEAKATAKRIEEANKKTEELLLKQQKLLSDQILQGKSVATPTPKPKDLTPEEYATEVEEGRINPLEVK